MNNSCMFAPGRGVWVVAGAVGQTVRGELRVPEDHPPHHEQLLPGQPGGQ